jgi:hypothetical protein
MNKNYSKKYKIESTNNEYFLNFESLEMEIQKKLRITLTHIVNNKNLNFYIEKSLNEILNEFSFLNCNSIKDLIDYLSELTKKDEITIEQKYKLMYNLVFLVGDKYINFSLKRKIDKNEENFKEIEDEIYNIYDKIISLENSICSQERKNNDLKGELQKQFEDFESRINSIYNNNINDNKDDGIAYKKIYTSDFYDDNKIIVEKSIVNSGNYSYSERNDSENYEINKNENKFLSIKFNKMKKQRIYNEDEECEIFISFNLKNNDPMFIWTIKSKSNIINAFNMRNSVRFQKTIKVHQNKIDCLKYYYNDIGDIENKEFIISFSEKDKYLIIWKINNDYEIPSLSLFKKITKSEAKISINIFCIFSNKKYSNKENYIFIYDKD